MYMVAVVTVTDLTTLMVTMSQDLPLWVDLNHHHTTSNYSHRHQSHAAWGAGGNGSMHGNRGARGREGVVVVYEYYSTLINNNVEVLIYHGKMGNL